MCRRPSDRRFGGSTDPNRRRRPIRRVPIAGERTENVSRRDFR